MSRMRTLATLWILLTALTASGQSPDELTERANEHFQQKEWSAAAELYAKLVETDAGNVRYWIRLGTARQQMQEFDAAVEAYQKVVASEAPAPFRALALFQGAESFAGMGAKDEALDWLGKSVELGFGQVARIESSVTLASVKGESFDGLLEKARANQSPCLYDEKHKQFDFWVGDWDVFVSGQPAGTNTIEKIVNGCVLFENWTGASGGTGKSFNFYDKADGAWHQLWVDGQGNVLRLAGTYADSVLHYQGETRGPDGKVVKERLRFYHLGPNRVRQFWEQSTDGGETWNVAFDGEYRRKKN